MGHGGHGGGGGQHNQMHQQQMVGQMQMAPMGSFGGQQFTPGGGMMGQQMGHMQQQQMHQQQMQQGGPMPQATGNRIYVGNLAWTVEWQELKDHMRTVGKVVHADVLQDGDGRSKVGLGWILVVLVWLGLALGVWAERKKLVEASRKAVSNLRGGKSESQEGSKT